MGECECAGISAVARFHSFYMGFLPIQHRRQIGKQPTVPETHNCCIHMPREIKQATVAANDAKN
jgi:hypothetical protein